MLATTGRRLSELYQEIVERCGSFEMAERGYRFSQEEKGRINKLLMEDKQLPDFGLDIERVSYADGCKVYFKGGGWLISWCVGHLAELSEPAAYDPDYAKWRLEDLPILPEKWRYQVSPSTKKQFQILRGLMGREDVASIVEAPTPDGRAS